MSDKKRFIKSALTGTLCGILTSVVLTCAFALILSRSGMLGDNILGYASAGLLAAGAFLGGFVSAKLNRAAGLIAGAAAGAAMLALIVLVSAFMGNSGFTALFFIKAAALLIGGALGGVISIRNSGT